MGEFTGSLVLSFVWSFLLWPKIRDWSLVMAYSLSCGASCFSCIVRARACVDFTIMSNGVNLGGFIA